MTKRPYSYQLYQLKGTISSAYLDTANSKLGKVHPFYCLEIEKESWFGKSQETIYVFSNLVSPEIWNTLSKEDFKRKTYHFFCEKRVRGWRLKNWEQIK